MSSQPGADVANRAGPVQAPRAGGRTSAGMVTAEAALVLPIVAIFALTLVWVISVGIAEVRVVDAARDAARSLARGDAVGAATQAAWRTAGRDAAVQVKTEGRLVSVRVSDRVAMPGWLLVPVPPVTVSATSRVESEDAVPTP